MLKSFFVMLLFCSVTFAQDADKAQLDKELHKIKEEMKTMGDDSIPVSPASRKKIDTTFENAKKDNKKRKDENDTLSSFDCKTWVKDTDKMDTTKVANKLVMYMKDKNGEYSYINEGTQTQIFGGRNVYFRILRDAMVLINGSAEKLSYRPVSANIRRDMVGIIQAIGLFAVEMGEHWQPGAANGEPWAMAFFSHETNSPELQKYHATICKSDGCFMVLKKETPDGERNVPLVRGSPEHLALTKKGLFTTPKIQVMDKMCFEINQPSFQTQLKKDFDQFQAQCGLPRKEPYNSREFADYCSKLKSQITPVLSKYL